MVFYFKQEILDCSLHFYPLVNIYHRVLCVSQWAGGSLWASTVLRWRAACSAARGRSYTPPSSNITSDSCCREPPGAAERGAPPSRTRVRPTHTHTGETLKGQFHPKSELLNFSNQVAISQLYFLFISFRSQADSSSVCRRDGCWTLWRTLHCHSLTHQQVRTPLSGWTHTCSSVNSVQHFIPGLAPLPVQTGLDCFGDCPP